MKGGLTFDLRIDEKHVWVVVFLDGKRFYEIPLARMMRDYLQPYLQKDTDSGEVAKGFQPEVAFAKLKLSNAIKKELEIA